MEPPEGVAEDDQDDADSLGIIDPDDPLAGAGGHRRNFLSGTAGGPAGPGGVAADQTGRIPCKDTAAVVACLAARVPVGPAGDRPRGLDG